MKTLIFILLFLSNFFIPIVAISKDVTISGKVTGDLRVVEAQISLPVNNKIPLSTLVKVDSLGQFEIKLAIEKEIFVSIALLDFYQVIMIVEPGENYSLEFSVSKEQDNKNKFYNATGKNISGIEYLNTLGKFVILDAQQYKTDTSATAILSTLKTKKDLELKTFKKLKDEGKISTVFYNLAAVDRECYYAALISRICSGRYYRENKNGRVLSKSFAAMYNDVFEKYPIQKEGYFSSFYWYDYSENFLDYYSLFNKSTTWRELAKSEDFSSIRFRIKAAQDNFNDKALENYLYYFFYYTTDLDRPVAKQDMIDEFERFKKQYSSPYARFIEPRIQKFRDYIAAENGTLKDATFLLNSENQSLKGIFTQMKGKPFYIDLWATWCGPCRFEFTHVDKTSEELLKKYNVAQLYVSIDKDEKEAEWRRLIKFYDLKGFHVRTNKKLRHELDSVLNTGQPFAIPHAGHELDSVANNGPSYSIPRYLLVNKSGVIINANAPRLSNPVAIRKALEAGLK